MSQDAKFEFKGDHVSAKPAHEQRRIWIGTAARCELRLAEHFTISKLHARIDWDGREFYLTDTDEAGATFVNQEPVEYDAPVALADGDVLQIGPHVLTLNREGARLEIKVERLLARSTFLIKRSDKGAESDVNRLAQDVLLVCNPPDQSAAGTANNTLILNDPKVAALHAGISRFKDALDSMFCLIPLSAAHATRLNGRLLRTDEPVPLATGDVAQIGPYDLTFTVALPIKLATRPKYWGVRRAALQYQVVILILLAKPVEGETILRIDVTRTVAGAAVVGHASEATTRAPTASAPAQVAAAALRIFWAKRTREKAAPHSPLEPQADLSTGKARYKWRPTTDLARPWPLSVWLWYGLAAVGVLAVLASTCLLPGVNAFGPRPLSRAHASANFIAQPATAREPNANACLTCHAYGRSKAELNAQCASCHQVAGTFVATVTPPHEQAGIGCVDCHTEHKGADFRPGLQQLNASFQTPLAPTATCAGCHSKDNQQRYHGKAAPIAHGGQPFGYPVTNGRWTWPGLTEAERTTKAEDFRQRIENFNRYWRGRSENKKLNDEFHALHDERLRVGGGLTTNKPDGSVSCSTCHNSWGDERTVDHKSPRQTCVVCHGGYIDPLTKRPIIAADQPNCNSCHVQHILDARRPPAQLITVRGSEHR